MTQWKSPARPSRSTPPPRPAPPGGLPVFGGGSLSTGVVPVLVRPVAAPEVAELVSLVLWRIRGVGGVELVGIEGGAAEFAVTLLRPVALGSDLRSAFGREVIACRKEDDRFVVDVHPPAAPTATASDAPTRSPLQGPRSPASADAAADGRGPRRSTADRPEGPAPRREGRGPVPGGGHVAGAGSSAVLGGAAGDGVSAAPGRPATRGASAAPGRAMAGGAATAPSAGAGDAASRRSPDDGPEPHAIPRHSVDVQPESPGHVAASPLGVPEPVAAVYDALDADDSVSVVVTGPEHVIRTSMGGLHRHFGRAVTGGLVGRSLAEVLPLGAQQALADRVSAAVRGTRSTFVVEDLPGDRVCEFVLHPASLGGTVHGCVVVTRDVTRRRRQEQVAGELSSVLDAMFDASWVAVGLVSPRGEWLRVNPALERLLAHRATTLAGMRVDDVTQVDDVAREARIRERAERGGDPSYEIEKRMIRGTGEVIVVQTRMTAIVHAGELRGWVAHMADGDAVAVLDARTQPGRPRGLRRLGA